MSVRLADGIELDHDRRELRVGGAVVPLQARVFSLLSYLVRERDRVVSRDDLIAAVWRGSSVSDSAIQRAVSLARTALGDAGRIDHRLLRSFAWRMAGRGGESNAQGHPSGPTGLRSRLPSPRRCDSQ